MLFLVQKNVLFVIFFFSCVNIVFCELMLLELGDLLGLSLLRNFFSAANISARLLNISSSSNLIPHFVLHISRLPDIAQKTACTQNEAMDVTFQMKYALAFYSSMHVTREIKQILGGAFFFIHPVNDLRQISSTILDNYPRLSQTIILDYLRHLSLTFLDNYPQLSQTTSLNYLSQRSQTILDNYPRLSQKTILDYLRKLS